MTMPKPLILLDTDINTDCGDAGAVALLHALADAGEARIIGIGVSVSNPDAPVALMAINDYYGRADLPIARYQGQPPIELHDGHPFLGAMRDMCRAALPDPMPDTTDMYRRVLADAPDGSVVMVAIGFHNTLQRLLQSPADAVSPLDGFALVRAKITQLIVMGGQYPDSQSIAFPAHRGAEYNFYRAPIAADFVCHRWPTPIIFTGFELGDTIRGGRTLSARTPADNPVRIGYEVAGSAVTGRNAWDETAILYAVRGTEHGGMRYFGLVHGVNKVDPVTGANVFAPSNDRPPHAYLTKAVSDEQFSQLLDDLQSRPPACGG